PSATPAPSGVGNVGESPSATLSPSVTLAPSGAGNVASATLSPSVTLAPSGAGNVGSNSTGTLGDSGDDTDPDSE
ncbi:unnamed protein product, partial [Ectocarpus sp. 12 AP-2014]